MDTVTPHRAVYADLYTILHANSADGYTYHANGNANQYRDSHPNADRYPEPHADPD
jgi:hypothetical protein